MTRPLWERLHVLAARQDGIEGRTKVLEQRAGASDMRAQEFGQRLNALELRVTELGAASDRLVSLEARVVAYEQQARGLEETMRGSTESAARIREVVEVVSAQNALSRQNRRELDTLVQEFGAFVSEARQELHELISWKNRMAENPDPSLH